MKPIQKKIVELASARDIGSMSYRKIAELIGGEHPYQVQYNMNQLVRDGVLVENKRQNSIAVASGRQRNDSLLKVPIMGMVSCGEAVLYANNEVQGYIAVSPSLVNARTANRTYALQASGHSMNRANIGGNNVSDGDLVVVRHSDWSEAREGEYVVSLIDGCANLKRLHFDYINSRVVLLSESNDETLTPIVIAKEDLDRYKVLGIAVDVIKAIPSYS